MNELDELRRLKTKYRLTNEQIGAMLGVSTRMVSQWFLVPSWERLAGMRAALSDNQKPLWTDVNASLPPVGEYVICHVGEISPVLMKRKESGEWESDLPVTYWMHVPEIPD